MSGWFASLSVAVFGCREVVLDGRQWFEKSDYGFKWVGLFARS